MTDTQLTPVWTRDEWEAAFDAWLEGLGATLYGRPYLITEGNSRAQAASELADAVMGAAFKTNPKAATQLESIAQRDRMACPI